MSTSPYIVHINLSIQQMNIYVAIFIYVTGVIGSVLNIIIFTSLKTFRETSCGFYLIFTSFFNAGQTIFALTTRILDSGFAINLTNTSWSCKVRTYLAQSFVLLSLTSMSLVTIDQYFSISQYRRWSGLRLARRNLIIGCLVWAFHGVAALLYWDTPRGVCTMINHGYRTYIAYFYLPVLLGCLPIGVMMIFALLAFHRIRKPINQEIGVVRLSHDRQLTAMALSQVIFILIGSLPFTIFNIYDLSTQKLSPEAMAEHRLIGTITVLLYYENFAVSSMHERFDRSEQNLY